MKLLVIRHWLVQCADRSAVCIQIFRTIIINKSHPLQHSIIQYGWHIEIWSQSCAALFPLISSVPNHFYHKILKKILLFSNKTLQVFVILEMRLFLKGIKADAHVWEKQSILTRKHHLPQQTKMKGAKDVNWSFNSEIVISRCFWHL